MFQWIIDFSVRNKFIIAFGTLLLAVMGIWSLGQLPIDAVPDITNNQVQIVTTSPTLAPQEVEQLITYPIEIAMANLPGVTEIRSISRFGLSVVTIVFEDDVPVLEARQYVREQISLAEASIPTTLGKPELMPITTGLGEIYQYVLVVDPAHVGQYDIMELRTIQDWIVKRQLNGIAGIVDVSSFGGYVKQYEVSVHPERLQSLDVTLTDVYDALSRNNENSGGSYIEKHQNAFYIRTAGLVANTEDIEQIVVTTRKGQPVLIRDVATVRYGHMSRFGAMTMDGLGETVGGITLMLKGANSSEAIQNVHQRVEEIRETLPPGVSLYAYLDRSELVARTMKTASKNLIEGGLIVIFVLVLLLGNWRAGIIVASVIPLSMLFAITLMRYFGVSANLMSLGAIDFGIVVDGAVIIVESVLHIIYTHHVGKRLTQREMDGVISSAAGSIYKSAAFGVLIILVVFIPIISLTGIEGKMFRPMAMTVSFAILGALLLSVTYVPMLTSLMLRKDILAHYTFSDKLIGKLRQAYRPTLEYALRIPYVVVGVAVALLVVSIFAFTRMGAEFLPTLEEGDLAMQMAIQPGSSLTESVATTTKAEQILLQHFPEIKHVVSKIGTAEIPTDPMAVEDADIMIVMKPRSEWTSAATREELVAMMKDKLAVIPGASFEFTQPIQLRFNELMTGAKADVAVKIFGEDLDLLADLGQKAAVIIQQISGAGDVKVEQTEGFPQLMVNFNRQKIAEYGLDITTINQLIRAAYAGEIAGMVYEGERKFDLVVRLDPAFRHEVNLGRLYVHTSEGGHIPLSEVATVNYAEGPMQISREDTKRRITIGVNVRQRDVASLVADIRQALAAQLPLPPGYSIQYGGQFENLEAARSRLSVVVPVALLLIFMLLYFAFGSFRYALLIFSTVPLSAIGGVVALLLRDMPFSISAGVGFIALFGVAVLNGIVLISYFNKLQEEGMTNVRNIVIEGGLVRLRPVVMTAAVASLGFLPMALSGSAGAEVQKPLATVVIGGLLTATFLTLVVLPVLYYLTTRKRSVATGVAGLLALALGLMPDHLQAQQQPLTLENALQHAVDYHPLLQRSALEVEKAALSRRQAWDLPALDVNIEYGQINAAAQDLRVNVVQNLGILPAHMQRARLAQATIAFAEADLGRQQALLLNEVELAWHDWLYQTEATETYLQMEKLYETIADKSRLRLQTGDISVLDWQIAHTALAKAKQQTADARLRLQEATTRIRQLVWLDDYPITPCDSLPVKPWPEELMVGVPSALLSPYNTWQQVAAEQWKLEKSQFFPELHIGYFNQQLEKVNGFQGILAGATIPLWFTPQKSRIQQAELTMQQASLAARQATQEYQLTSMQLLMQCNLLYEQLKTTLPELRAQALQLQQAAQLEWEQGAIDQLRYLQLLDQALQLRLQYLDGVHQYNQTLITWSLYTN